MPDTRMVARLKATAAVTNLVGTRIEPIRSRQAGALPRITWMRVGTAPINSAAGTTGEAEVRFQIDCFGSTYASARAVADAVTGALSGWNDASSCVWHKVMDFDDPENPDTGQDVGLYRIVHDYLVFA